MFAQLQQAPSGQLALQRVWRAKMLQAHSQSLALKENTQQQKQAIYYLIMRLKSHATKSKLFNDINYGNQTEIYPYSEDKISPNLTCGRLKSGLIHLSAHLLPTLRNKYNSD